MAQRRKTPEHRGAPGLCSGPSRSLGPPAPECHHASIAAGNAWRTELRMCPKFQVVSTYCHLKQRPVTGRSSASQATH